MNQPGPSTPPPSPSPSGPSYSGGNSPNVDGFKGAIMDAIEILKLNKEKMRQVMANPSATMYAWIFLIAPALINSLIMVAWLGRYGFSWHAPSVLMQPIGILVFVYAIHFSAVKFFKGQGQLSPFFRAYGYANAVQLLNIPLTLLMMMGMTGLMALSGLVVLVAAIFSIIVTYNALKENYKLSSEHTIFTFIIAIVIAAVVNMILTSVLLPILFPAPTPIQQLHEIGDIYKNLLGQ